MLQITQNRSFGQLYVAEGRNEVRIPATRIRRFFQRAKLTQAQVNQLRTGRKVTVRGHLYNFADLAG